MIAWVILIIFLAIILAVLVAAVRLIVGPKAEPTEPKQPLTAGQLVGILVVIGVIVLIGMTVRNMLESQRQADEFRDRRVDCYTEQLMEGGRIDMLGC